ncbi:MAG: DUF4153 domain-containing protein [Tetragenococcus sp.]|nr:DUF4153 domain-containing protein [Tetragenococcus sp.]
MTKRKKFFDQLLNIGKAYKEYPMTMFLFILLALVNSWEIANEFTQYERILLTLLLAISLTLLSKPLQQKFFEGRLNQFFLPILSVFLSILYYFYLPSADSFYLIANIRTGILVFTLLIAFIWIPSIKNERRHFYQYFLATFKALFTTILYTTILLLGVQAIISAIDYLFFSIDYEYFMHLANIIGFIIAPSYFLSSMAEIQKNHMKDIEKDAPSFEVTSLLKTLLNYILIPLIAVYTFVLLIYMIINFGGELWKDNLLEPMLISYIILFILLYLLALNLSGKIANLFKKIFPKILILIVLFQIIASYLKINELGLTLGRYYVISFGVFALIAGFIFSFSSKEKSDLIIPVFLFLSFLSLLPGISAFALAEKSQKKLLFQTLDKNEMIDQEKLIAKEEISRQDQEKITSSLEYLEDYGYLKELNYLPDDFYRYEDFKTTFGFSMTYGERDRDSSNYHYASLERTGEEVYDVRKEDYFLELFIENYAESDEIKELEIDGDYSIQLSNQATYPRIILKDKRAASVLEVNLEELFKKVFSEEDSEEIRNQEEMTLIQENENYRIRILAYELMENKEEETFNGQLYLFLKIK